MFLQGLKFDSLVRLYKKMTKAIFFVVNKLPNKVIYLKS